jgi:hypothetical protein
LSVNALSEWQPLLAGEAAPLVVSVTTMSFEQNVNGGATLVTYVQNGVEPVTESKPRTEGF